MYTLFIYLVGNYDNHDASLPDVNYLAHMILINHDWHNKVIASEAEYSFSEASEAIRSYYSLSILGDHLNQD
jgi:hypothetical protein